MLKWFLSTQTSVLLNFSLFISKRPVLAFQVFKCFLVNFLNGHLAVHLLFIFYGHILEFCHMLFPSCILWMFLSLLCFSVALTGLFFNWALHLLKVHDKESKWTEENKFFICTGALSLSLEKLYLKDNRQERQRDRKKLSKILCDILPSEEVQRAK